MFSPGSSSGSQDNKTEKGEVAPVLNWTSHHEGTWDSEGIGACTLKLSTKWRWVISFRLWPPYTWGQSPICAGHRCGSWETVCHCREDWRPTCPFQKKTISIHRSQSLSPSHYTTVEHKYEVKPCSLVFWNTSQVFVISVFIADSHQSAPLYEETMQYKDRRKNKFNRK